MFIVLGSLALGAGLVEGALRIRQWIRYGTFATTFYQVTLDPETGLHIPTPGSQAGRIEINESGFRGALVETPKPAGRVRLGFLGGSTTFCAETTSLEATWPHRMVSELAEHYPEAQFDYVNGGAAGFSTAESRVNLEHRIAPLEPDVLVIYHATNDITRDSREQALEAGLWSPPDAEGGLGDWLMTWHLLEKNIGAATLERQAFARLDLSPTELASAFRTRLEALVEEAKATAPVVVVGTFSHRVRRDQSPEERAAGSRSSLYYMPFMTADSILEAFEEYNRIIREVAAEAGVLLVEAADQVPGDAVHFRDSVHLTDEGCARLAESFVERLVDAPAFQALAGEGD